MKIIDVSDWSTFASTLPEKTIGSARIKKLGYKAGTYHNWGMKGYDFFQFPKEEKITTLQLLEKGKWKTWMVDDPPHWWAMQTYAMNSKGRVLVGGLGLGMVASELTKNPDVTEITVVEKNPDVIALLRPHLPEKVRIVQGDLWKFVETAPGPYDRAIIDIWVGGGMDWHRRVVAKEVAPLAAKIYSRWPDADMVFHGFGDAWIAPFLRIVTKDMEELRKMEKVGESQQHTFSHKEATFILGLGALISAWVLRGATR